MRNLARHIELLLRNNDCVVIPGFGGFIAHSIPAYYVKEEGLYYPPSRSISFNAAITTNDGLLAQSYMKSFQVDYSRATYMIDMATEKLIDTLDEEGCVNLPHIGTIRQDIFQSLLFTPETSGITSPQHFGLGSFLIKELWQLNQTEEVLQNNSVITHTEKTINVHINKAFLRKVMSTAAILLLLLMISLPTGNHKPTDIASLHLNEIINIPLNISTETMAYTGDSKSEAIETLSHINSTELSSLSTKTEEIESLDIEFTQDITSEVTAESTSPQQTVIPATEMVQVTPEVKPIKTYHIIVASLPNHRGASETLEQYINNGYSSALLIERDDRVRISLMQFVDKNEANEYLKELRENVQFENAWLLAVRN